jgi:hypothetical protein
MKPVVTQESDHRDPRDEGVGEQAAGEDRRRKIAQVVGRTGAILLRLQKGERVFPGGKSGGTAVGSDDLPGERAAGFLDE